MNKSKTFKELITGQGMDTVERVIGRVSQLRRLDGQLRQLLDPEIARHCQLANVRGNSAVFIVASTVWATRLRYQLPKLLADAQQTENLSHITDIKIRVQPSNTASPSGRPRHAKLSKDAAHCLEQCASGIDDEQLRCALQRLASRQKTKT